jgi:opacity protein-like surface antigen
MTKMTKIFSLAVMLVVTAAGAALATPSTQIWIPSTDIQGYKTLHLGIDNYIRTSNKGGFPNLYDVGLTAGVLPFEKLQMEVGVDYLDGGQGGIAGSFNELADKNPIYFNGKIGTPEDSLFKYSPALAAGLYNAGTKAGLTGQNIVYGLAAKTLPVIGRLSAGGFHGSETVLGKGKNNGVLASWDRTMSEISDKLWMAVDYQSGNSFMGAVSFGVSWAFAKNVSVIVGYDIYNNPAAGGKNTVTTQLDINFP